MLAFLLLRLKVIFLILLPRIGDYGADFEYMFHAIIKKVNNSTDYFFDEIAQHCLC